MPQGQFSLAQIETPPPAAPLGRFTVADLDKPTLQSPALADRQPVPLVRGNIDLRTRPVVVNGDGSISSVHTMGITDENPTSPHFGKEVLIPTVIPNAEGTYYTDLKGDASRAYYYKTGQHLGVFPAGAFDAADEYAQRLHEDYAAGKYGEQYKPIIVPARQISPAGAERGKAPPLDAATAAWKAATPGVPQPPSETPLTRAVASVLTAPVRGAKEMVGGMRDLAAIRGNDAETWKAAAGATSRVLRGGFTAAEPAVVIAAAVNPVATAVTVGGAALAAKVTELAGRALKLDPRVTGFASDLAALIGGAGSAKGAELAGGVWAEGTRWMANDRQVRVAAANTLGVKPTATPAEIQSAYRAAARANHPDLNPNADTAKMADINLAAQWLLDNPRVKPIGEYVADWKDTARMWLSNLVKRSTAAPTEAAAGEHALVAAPESATQPPAVAPPAPMAPAEAPVEIPATVQGRYRATDVEPTTPAAMAPNKPSELHLRRELQRMVGEMENFGFTPRGFVDAGRGRGGDLEVVPGAAGTPLYDDILQAAPGTSKYTRGQVIVALRQYLKNGKITNPVRGAIAVAEARHAGVTTLGGQQLSKPLLELGDFNEPGRIYVNRAKDLTPAERTVESQATELVESKPAEMVAAYRQRFPDVIGADEAKELFPAYATSPEARTANTLAVHRPSQALAQAVYDQVVKAPPREDRAPQVVFTAGGMASGKTSALDAALPNVRQIADVVYDSTLSDTRRAFRNIDAALDSNRGVTVMFPYRPIEAAFRSALERAKTTGRIVTVEAMVRSHINALKTVQAIHKRYGDLVDILVVDNAGAPSDVHVGSMEELGKVRYNEPDVRQALTAILDAEEAAGTLTPALAAAVRGHQADAEDHRNGPLDRQSPPQPESRQVIDRLDTGEAQPRLPEAGAVREQNVATPQFDAPFSLTPEAAKASSVQTPLFAGKGGGGSAASVGSVNQNTPGRSAPIPKPDDRRLFPGKSVGTTTAAQPVQFPELVDLARRLQGVPKVVRAFRNPFKQGEFSQRGIKLTGALFKPGQEYQLAATLAHEIGHLIDFLPHETLKRGNLLGRLFSLRNFLKHTFTADSGNLIENKVIRAELKKLSDAWRPWDEKTASPSFRAYRNSGKEQYADALSVLFNDPARLEREAPTFYKEFFNALDRKPDVRAAYFDLQEVLAGTPEELIARRRHGVRRMFEEGDATALELERQRQAELAARNKNLWLRLKIEHVDKNYRVIDKVLALEKQGTRLLPDEDPRYALEERTYLGSTLKAFTERHFLPIFTAVTKGDIHWNAFSEALFYERIIAGDRSEMANPRGLSPDHAKELYDSLKKELGPEKERVLATAVTDFRAAVRTVAEQAHQAGLYTDELYAQMKENPAYVAFQVIDHMEDGMTSRVYKQVGTLKDIGNVADATILKTLITMRAIEHQKVKRSVFQLLQRHFPAEITEAKTVWTGKGHRPIESKDPQQRLITYYEKGVLKGKYVDPYIADALENASIAQNLAVVGLFRSMNNAWFRPVFTTLNTGFQIANFARDFWRFWKNVPGMTLPRAMQRYVESVPLARVRAFGLRAQPTIPQMRAQRDLMDAEQQRILSVTFNNLVSGRQVEDTQIEDILARTGVGGFEPGRPSIFTKPFLKILDAIRQTGDFVETLPKAAAMYDYKGKGTIADISAEKRSFIRRKVGSPDFLTRGTASALNNEILLFSNAITQALRSDYEVATDPKTRSGFWWKTATVNLLPKALMALAMAGLFGETLRRLYQKTTEYDRTNYLLVPIGQDAKDNAIYLRVPQDDSGRLISGLFWKALNVARGDHDVVAMLAQVFSYVAGQGPGLSPGVRVVEDLTQFASGQNPYDEFRGRNVFTDEEWKAGGWGTMKKFIGYEFQQLGGGIVWKFYPGEERPRTLTKGQEILEIPIISNVAGRFLRITNYGEVESLRQVKAQVQQQEARTRLSERKSLNTAIRSYLALPAKEQSAGQRWRMARDVANEVYSDRTIAERAQRTSQIVKKLKLGAVRGEADALADTVMEATSNDQKVAVLLTAKKQMSQQEWAGWLREAAQEGILSKNVLQDLAAQHAAPAAAAGR